MRFCAEIFSGSENYYNFLKIPKWQHKHEQEYRRGKLFFCLLSNATKTWLLPLKILKNIEIKITLHFRTFLCNTICTSCLSALKFPFWIFHKTLWNKVPFNPVLLFVTAFHFSFDLLLTVWCQRAQVKWFLRRSKSI